MTDAPSLDGVSRARSPRILLADRGDPLVGPMTAALRRRFDVVGRVDAELSAAERLVVAGLSVSLPRRRWSERFHKSDLAVRRRTRRVRVGLERAAGDVDVVFQTHGLFEVRDPRTVMYLDCTHRQSMEQWPAWSPLRGRHLDRWLDREHRQFHGAAHLFAFSEETAGSLTGQYGVPPERVSVVGAGPNLDRLPAPEPARPHPPTVLFVGNDFERKGGPTLLEAFSLLRRRLPGARLRIVGTPYPARRRDGVERLGRVRDRATMSRLYREADVFCLPAHFDPFPGALLEAMAHGLPCVVAPTCGIPEIVVDGVTALSVPRAATSAADLASALEQLLREPARAAEMGRLGRRRVEDRFLWNHVVERMAPVLERVSRPQPPRAATAVLSPPSPRGERP